MAWFELKIKTTSEATEAISNILIELGCEGVAVEDPNDPIFGEGYEGDWDYFNREEMTFEYEGALIKTYVEDTGMAELIQSISARIEELSTCGLDYAPGTIETTEIFESDWANEWKKYYKPTKIGKYIVIKPSWEAYEAEQGELIIEIDPGSAFGSGTHETTSMCIEQLDKRVKPETTVFDIGCGSGILAIAAAKLGANDVTAVDLDLAAIEASNENVLLNHVENQVKVLHGNLMDVVNGKADIVVANIIADIICLLSETIHQFLHQDSVFIASGIINTKIPQVLATLEANQLEVIEVVEKGEWAAIVSKLK
jgi:ribosomal protein L11 methyltransferase